MTGIARELSVQTRPAPVAAGLLCLCLAGCATHSLDYQTALNLLREHQSEPIKITISASPRLGESDLSIKQAYAQLTEGHVLDCQPNPTVGTFCQPGPAGGGITAAGSTDLSLVAGRWVPLVINEINRSGSSTSTAGVRFSFEPSPLYKEYQGAFDTLQNSAEGRTQLAQQKDGKSVQAVFVYSDEGWQLESVL